MPSPQFKKKNERPREYVLREGETLPLADHSEREEEFSEDRTNYPDRSAKLAIETPAETNARSKRHERLISQKKLSYRPGLDLELIDIAGLADVQAHEAIHASRLLLDKEKLTQREDEPEHRSQETQDSPSVLTDAIKAPDKDDYQLKSETRQSTFDLFHSVQTDPAVREALTDHKDVRLAQIVHELESNFPGASLDLEQETDRLIVEVSINTTHQIETPVKEKLDIDRDNSLDPNQRILEKEKTTHSIAVEKSENELRQESKEVRQEIDKDSNQDRHQQPLEVPEEQTTRQSIECYLPLKVAEKIDEMELLEPETLVYLREKYSFIERHVEGNRDSCEPASEKIAELTDHTELLVDGKEGPSLNRAERAESQIEELQQSAGYAHALREDELVLAIFSIDAKEECYKLQETQSVKWEELELSPAVRAILDTAVEQRESSIELPLSVKTIIDERGQSRCQQEQNHNYSSHEHSYDLSADKLVTQQPAQHTKRTTVMPLERDLVKRREEEVDRAAEDMPPPGQFIHVRLYLDFKTFSSSFVILQHWHAYTIGEFNMKCGGVEATSGAWDLITEVDKDYNAWIARVENKRVKLDIARHEESEALLQILGLKIETSYETCFPVQVLWLCSLEFFVDHFPELLVDIFAVNSKLFFD